MSDPRPGHVAGPLGMAHGAAERVRPCRLTPGHDLWPSLSHLSALWKERASTQIDFTHWNTEPKKDSCVFVLQHRPVVLKLLVQSDSSEACPGAVRQLNQITSSSLAAQPSAASLLTQGTKRGSTKSCHILTCMETTRASSLAKGRNRSCPFFDHTTM